MFETGKIYLYITTYDNIQGGTTMANHIFRTLLEEKAKNFAYEFSNTAKLVFVKEDGKIYHNGEYGMYRESISKEFLRSFIPGYLDINNGFIITPDDKVSTQCDIIIYDREHTPIIQSEEKQCFFPVETVLGIGEVKSTLSRSDFKEAINKLAKNKSLRNFAKLTHAVRVRGELAERNSEIPYNNIFSFLICEKLNFNIENMEETFNELYEDIDYKYRHNLILSIKDRIILYSKEGKLTHLPKVNYNNTSEICTDIQNCEHIIMFLNFLNMAMTDMTVYYPEFSYYWYE